MTQLPLPFPAKPGARYLCTGHHAGYILTVLDPCDHDGLLSWQAIPGDRLTDSSHGVTYDQPGEWPEIVEHFGLTPLLDYNPITVELCASMMTDVDGAVRLRGYAASCSAPQAYQDDLRTLRTNYESLIDWLDRSADIIALNGAEDFYSRINEAGQRVTTAYKRLTGRDWVA